MRMKSQDRTEQERKKKKPENVQRRLLKLLAPALPGSPPLPRPRSYAARRSLEISGSTGIQYSFGLVVVERKSWSRSLTTTLPPPPVVRWVVLLMVVVESVAAVAKLGAIVRAPVEKQKEK